ncbi:hypothetical protein FGB62_24g010 [Gracilaria domingensis]|nr:hypothetical protein FGB62_24g010 [Gracilaria domingensis]
MACHNNQLETLGFFAGSVAAGVAAGVKGEHLAALAKGLRAALLDRRALLAGRADGGGGLRWCVCQVSLYQEEAFVGAGQHRWRIWLLAFKTANFATWYAHIVDVSVEAVCNVVRRYTVRSSAIAMARQLARGAGGECMCWGGEAPDESNGREPHAGTASKCLRGAHLISHNPQPATSARSFFHAE